MRSRVAFAMGADELRAALFPADLMARLDATADIVGSRVLTEFSSQRP